MSAIVERAKSSSVVVASSAGTGSGAGTPRMDLGGRSTASTGPASSEMVGAQHHAPCAPPWTNTTGNDMNVV